ncbi:hypothetical protein CISIN_1g031611mg [Citrus sinensis]|nr:hypothetical protein CISIN_1g031611mg [Citrus sinensis]
MVKAVAVLGQTHADETVEESDADGTVTFSQEGNRQTRVGGRFTDLEPDGAYALVIHQYGDIRDGWKSTGDRFKPAGIAGVIAHFVADDEGTARFDLGTKADLSGENSVMSRGLVLHVFDSSNPCLNVSSGSIPRPDINWDKYLGPGVDWAVIGLAR